MNSSDLSSVIKDNIKNLFDELSRKKGVFKYIIRVKITLKKLINDNEFNLKTLYFNSLIKTNKYFMWCHVRLINSTNIHPERINKHDKKVIANLNYSDIVFPLDINDYKKTEDRFRMQVNAFGYENKVYPLCISKKSYNQTLNLLLITEKGKSHYVFIKDFNRLMFSKTKHIDKKHFCLSCLQNFSTKEILNNHRKRSLLIIGCQAVIYESRIIKFKNCHKQIPILSKICADTEFFLKRTKIKEGEHTIKYQEHYPNSIGAKLVCIDDRFTLSSNFF